ncbi:class II aldolase/adducin family protein [Rhodococcus sp. HNM0569]|uniref:class II aldolase/adducin family protein n=1 Tax=Rhodococcus sp. HNM0569 TaxID=2716340 RepID=UPI00146EEFB5|nr:class II aldolase/adducin family protein [Rhodococcus sp. HNM0569]NLU85081.1 class II aldolase/adducin family protein [Rhodococcus sp. HNM0569]
MTVEALRADVVAACHDLARRGLVHGTAGNVSAREGDLVAVTATGVVLADASQDDITIVTVDGTRVEGSFAPTSEIGIHLGVYRDGDARAVVHAHSSTAVALTLVADELPPVHYQQLTLGGTIPVVPFAPFGSTELADATRRALQGRTAALLAHHGSLAIGPTLPAALENLTLLDWLCRIYLDAAAVARPRALSPDQLQAVVEQAIRLRYGNRQATGDEG